MKPGRERRLVTAAVMLGLFLAALEATAVAAAVPTAVGQMGGVARYSWVFSAYLLTSTTTVPLFGKFADLYGRKRTYHVAVALFLLGSALSGMSRSLTQLIVFRAVQGLGAGGVMPVAITVSADIYTLQERGRVQGLFSGVWALASLVGPLLGGIITDALSWRWVFYLNIPFGIASSAILQRYLHERRERREHTLDVAGTLTLTAAVTLVLLALIEGPDVWGWGDPRTLALFAGSAVALALFLRQERRTAEPMLPLELFENPAIAVSSLGNAVIGTILFTLTAYVPMFAQGVLGGSAVDAGTVLTPVLIGWPISSTLSGRLLLRVGYRRLAILGGVLALAGGVLLAGVDAASGRAGLFLPMLLFGLGLGFASTPYLIAVQSAVPWRLRGVATSTVQFFRTIGGAVAVAALGALFNARLAATVGGGLNPNAALDPALRRRLDHATLARLTAGLLDGLHHVYLVVAVIAGASLLVALIFPKGRPEDLQARPEGMNEAAEEREGAR
jgi:EmrB/QacA subfamily drug resistance transporter